MKCPSCGAATRVYDVRDELEGAFRRRSRICKRPGCWLRFKTREVPEPGSYDLTPLDALDPHPGPTTRVTPAEKSGAARAQAESAAPCAASQGGYFTAADATCSPSWLRDLVLRGAVVRLARNAYRLAHVPPSRHERAVIAWLWTGRVGLCSHETALELAGLTEPDVEQDSSETVHLALPAEWRPRRRGTPRGLVLHQAEAADVVALDLHGDRLLPTVSVARALVQCLARPAADVSHLRRLTGQAVERGLATADELLAEGRHAGVDARALLRPRRKAMAALAVGALPQEVSVSA